MELIQFGNKCFNLNVLLDKNNNPLFNGKEVATILGYRDTDGAIRRHVDEEDKQELKDIPVSDPGSFHPNQIFITEAGLYALIFGSEKPQAKEFKRWVFREVLPQIRQTGSYSLDNGLLKLKDISYQDLEKLSDSERKEFKGELKHLTEIMKDPEAQKRGHNGGTVLWIKVKSKEEELEEYKKKVEDVLLILRD